MTSAFGRFGKAAAKIATAATAAGATAVAILTKAAVSSYADYEQLVGGIDTLFKDSSKKVMDYANNAYKTAGLSANQYMETVTSFSASLLQSLGNDTAEAAEYGNMAVTDMADNANKMGTSMETIIATYQSLSRGNYAMLDNLKLGYGCLLYTSMDKKEIESLPMVTFAEMVIDVFRKQEFMDFFKLVSTLFK